MKFYPHFCRVANTTQPLMKSSILLLNAISILSLSSCAGRPNVPSAHGTYNGEPVLTRASHPSGGSMAAVDGVYLGRRYFHPPWGKSGLAWIDVYGQR